MRRLLPLAAFLILPLLGSDSLRECDDRAEMDELQGTWQLVAMTKRGKAVDFLNGRQTY